MTQSIKRLYRSERESRLAGVCGGIGEYLGIDPVIVRLIAIVATLMTGIVPGLLTYAVAWLVIPLEPRMRQATVTVEQTNGS